jgi:hypothetical protein
MVRNESAPVRDANTRIQYLERKLQTSIDETFDKNFINICGAENEIRQMATMLAQLRPTWSARLLLARNDVAAVSAGNNILAVTQCLEVHPERIFYDKKVNDTCYLQTPMLVHNQLWFAADGSQDLTRKGKQADCQSSHLKPVYQEDGKWTDGTHEIHVFEVDSHLQYRKHGSLLLFNTPDIFNRDSELIVTDPLEPLANIESRLDRLEIITVGSIATDIVEVTRRTTMNAAQQRNELYQTWKLGTYFP